MSAIHIYILALTAIFLVAGYLASRELAVLEQSEGHDAHRRSIRDMRGTP